MRRLLNNRRGLAVIDSLLALGLLGIMTLGGIAFLEQRLQEDRVRQAGRQLGTLANAAAGFVDADFTAQLAAARLGPRQITIAQLRAAGVLPAGFRDVDAMGRGHAVLIRVAGTDAIDVVVTQRVPAGDVAIPSAALFEAPGEVRLGLVPPEADTRLRGPTVDLDMSAFQSSFAGAPQTGALAAFRRFDQGTVFGDRLYRVAVPGFAAANRMETDLDLGGNAIRNAGAVAADSLDIEGGFTVEGDLTVTAGLIVGEGLQVGGVATVTGRVTAGDATVVGTARSASLTTSAATVNGVLAVDGAVTAGSAGVTGDFRAASASVTSLRSRSVTASTVNAGTAIRSPRIALGNVRVTGSVTAPRAAFTRLTVGNCTGC